MLIQEIKSCNTLQDVQHLLIRQGMERSDAQAWINTAVHLIAQEQNQLAALLAKYH